MSDTPKKNDVFQDTDDGKEYVFDGAKWVERGSDTPLTHAAVKAADGYYQPLYADAKGKNKSVHAVFAAHLEQRLAAVTKELADTQAENTRLRAALAQSSGACVYCSLPKEQWAACQSGFPGCARADDAMGCPELGARMERDEALARIKRLEDGGDKAIQNSYYPDRLAAWTQAKEAR